MCFALYAALVIVHILFYYGFLCTCFCPVEIFAVPVSLFANMHLSNWYPWTSCVTYTINNNPQVSRKKYGEKCLTTILTMRCSAESEPTVSNIILSLQLVSSVCLFASRYLRLHVWGFVNERLAAAITGVASAGKDIAMCPLYSSPWKPLPSSLLLPAHFPTLGLFFESCLMFYKSNRGCIITLKL